MHCFLLIYFSKKPLPVSSRRDALHQEDRLCWQDRDGNPSRSSHQPVSIKHDYIICCLYRVDPPDDDQQACSKHAETYY